MKVLLVTMEFVDPIFSGNGVLSRMVCAGLEREGHAVKILCGRKWDIEMHPHQALNITTIPLTTWGRLDREAGWEEFWKGAKDGNSLACSDVDDVDVILFVDWSSLLVVKQLLESNCFSSSGGLNPKIVFMCFRVFSASTSLHRNDDDLQFYKKMEQDSMLLSDHAVFLSRNDQAIMLREEGVEMPTSILFPPLRPEFVGWWCKQSGSTYAEFQKNNGSDKSMMTVTDNESGKERGHPRFRLLCCVRLSPEKHALSFVNVVRVLCQRGVVQQLGLVPTLCGSEADGDYARLVKATLRNVCDDCQCECDIIDGFVTHNELQRLFTETLVNIHPSKNDAYGMTIVEAAACGAISLVSNDGSVGAVELFETFMKNNKEVSANSCILLENVDDAEACASQIAAHLLQTADEESNANVEPMEGKGTVTTMDKEWGDDHCDTDKEESLSGYNSRSDTLVQIANSWTQTQYATALSSLLLDI
eukprot:m.2058 g.2058  ORF g.2058 m.2058 type:complete len:475 (-) comp1708_c0_seq1:172-1596(-)